MQAGLLILLAALTCQQPPGADAPLVYPVANQKNVSLSYPGRESPDPIPEAKDNNRRAGYPITITFAKKADVKKVSATLKEGAGQDVPVWVSSPEKPAFKPEYQANSVCVIAHDPLKPNTTYTVSVAAAVNAKEWKQSWSFTTGGPEKAAGDFEAKAVEKINAYRKAAGLGATTLDAPLSKACAAHAQYLVRNANPPGGKPIDPLDEDPKLPGFTEAGRKAAKNSLLGYDRHHPLAVIDNWMALVFHRLHILDPNLRSFGIGCARGTEGDWNTVIVLNRTNVVSKTTPILFCPEDKQKDVPRAFHNYGENPSPIPEGNKERAGYPITVMFPLGTSVREVTATLTDGSSKEVEVWLSTPEKPIDKDFQRNTVCLVPKGHLRPETAYTVNMTAKVATKPWKRSWTFTTVQEDKARVDEARVLERLNAFRKLAGLSAVALDPKLAKGCTAHAEYLVKNWGRPETQGLAAHYEDRNFPGYSEEGHKAGQASNLMEGAEPVDAIDGWMASFFHRIPLLDPELKRVGLGYAQGERSGWITVLNVKDGK